MHAHYEMVLAPCYLFGWSKLLLSHASRRNKTVHSWAYRSLQTFISSITTFMIFGLNTRLKAVNKYSMFLSSSDCAVPGVAPRSCLIITVLGVKYSFKTVFYVLLYWFAFFQYNHSDHRVSVWAYLKQLKASRKSSLFLFISNFRKL